MKINYKVVAEHLGVPLRGNETFTELLEIEKQVKANKKKITEYYYPKNKDGFTKKYWVVRIEKLVQDMKRTRNKDSGSLKRMQTFSESMPKPKSIGGKNE